MSKVPWTQLDQINYDLKIEPRNYAETHRCLLVETIARLPRSGGGLREACRCNKIHEKDRERAKPPFGSYTYPP